MSEIDIYGLFVPVLLIQAMLAYVVFSVSNRIVDQLNHAGWILYPNIFYLCWYIVCLLAVHGVYALWFN